MFRKILLATAAVAALATTSATAAAVVSAFLFGCIAFAGFLALVVEAVFDVAVLDRGDFVLFVGINLGDAAEVVVMMVMMMVIIIPYVLYTTKDE